MVKKIRDYITEQNILLLRPVVLIMTIAVLLYGVGTMFTENGWYLNLAYFSFLFILGGSLFSNIKDHRDKTDNHELNIEAYKARVARHYPIFRENKNYHIKKDGSASFLSQYKTKEDFKVYDKDGNPSTQEREVRKRILVSPDCPKVGPPPLEPSSAKILLSLLIYVSVSLPFVVYVFKEIGELFTHGASSTIYLWFADFSDDYSLWHGFLKGLLSLIFFVFMFGCQLFLLNGSDNNILGRLFSSIKKEEVFENIFFIKILFFLLIYLQVGVMFSGVWLFLVTNEIGFLKGPESLAIFDAIYFSFVTMTTLGYGDMTPLGWVSQWVAVWQTVFGVIYMGIVVGVSVGYGLNQANVKRVHEEQESDAVSEEKYQRKRNLYY